MDIPDEKRFHFFDGSSAQNLEELKAKIESISYDEFYGHVNEEKNDFANWVDGVLEMKELAEKLRSVGSIVETVELLNEELYPEEMEAATKKLTESEEGDLQERIEEQLFEQPTGNVEEAPPTIDSDAKVEEHSAPMPEGAIPVEEEPSIPPTEELEPKTTPGAPVTTTKEAHVPITERVGAPVTKEDHMKFVVKQFLYGFLMGIIVGFILGVVVSMLRGG